MPAGRFIPEMGFIYFYDIGREYISHVTWYCLLFTIAASPLEMHFLVPGLILMPWMNTP